jgi:hypothetical protein
MTGGLRIPIAWPHDGNVHDKGSGLGLAVQFKSYGANMMPKHAINHGTTDYRVEPGLQEMREMMFTGKLQIQPGNNELLEQMRHYHRDENFKISKGMDHLIDALRYAVMVRRSGKPRSECDGIGCGPLPYAGQQRVSGAGSGFAIGTPNHPGGEFDLFTGR